MFASKYIVKAIYIIAFFFSVNISAQNGVFKGLIYDIDNEGLPGAQLNISDTSSFTILTDIEGRFLTELQPGNYTIITSYSVLVNDTSNITIKPNEITTLNILLSEEASDLDFVVVSAGKFEQDLSDLTVSMEILRPELLENRNTTSIETALEQTPGLTILDSEPQIRGGSGFTFGVGSRVSVIVDGMPLLTGDAGRPEWGFIPVENIEQIEVIKGASSVLYGSSALSGVINIRTKYPRSEPLTKVTLNTGIYSAPKISNTWYDDQPVYGGVSFVHSRIIKENLDIVVGGNFFTDHGYIGPPNIDDTLIIDTITNFNNKDVWKKRGRLNFNLRYRSKKIEGLRVGINGNFMLSQTNFTLAWQDDSLNKFNAYPGAISLQNQSIFHVDPYIEYLAPNGLKHSLKTRLFVSNNQITNNQSNESKLWYGEYQMQKKFPSIADLNFTGGVVGTLAQSNSILYIGSGSRFNKISNIAGYSQLDKELWKVVNISVGVRMEYFSMNNVESVVKPVFRTGLSLKLTKGTTLRYSYGQGFRFPTITERFIRTDVGSFGVFPNQNLLPETSTNSEIGIKQGFKIGKVMGYLDLAGFHQEYNNTIEYLFGVWGDTWPLFGFKFMNTGDTRVRGVDISLMGKADFAKDVELTFLAGYTYVLPVALTPNEVYSVDSAVGGVQEFSFVNTSMDTSSHILKYRFQHTGKVNIDLRVKRFSVGFGARYYSYIRNIDKAFEQLEELTGFVNFIANIEYVDYWEEHKNGIVIFDARAGFHMNEHAKISIVVSNLINEEYALRPMKIESPRTTAIQYVHKF